MYGYEPRVFGYSDNLSICSTDTAVPTPSSSDLSSVTPATPSSLSANPTSAVSAPSNHHHLFKMNSTFMSEDPSRLAPGYASVDPAVGAGGILLDHHANGNHALVSNAHPGQQLEHHHHQGVVEHDLSSQQPEQQQPQIVRFSPSAETRTHTPAAKRSREDDESDAGESESNSRTVTEPNPVEKRSGRRKIKIEYIEDKSRRHITFSKRKAGIMKKAYELSTLTGTQVLLLVVSETGLVYTFTTPKLQPIVTQPEGKNLIQACLSVPDQPGERVMQPIPTESNAYMSQPRHSQVASGAGAYANSAMAAAVAAASNAAAMGGAANGNGAFTSNDDRKQHLGAGDGSPGAAGVNHAAQPYLQYQYGQNAVAQVVAAAANGGMQYTALPGYAPASYPNSNSQSQHHSPITTATQHAPQQQQQQQQQGADATSIPGMGSLASYHHGYSNHTQQQPLKQQNHYTYHSLQAQGQYQQHQSPYSAIAGSESQPGHNSSSVTDAMAAAVVAATASGNGHHPAQPQQGNIPGVPYMGGHWQPAAGLASPHLPQPQGQHQQSQQAAAGLIQRTGYGGSS